MPQCLATNTADGFNASMPQSLATNTADDFNAFTSQRTAAGGSRQQAHGQTRTEGYMLELPGAAQCLHAIASLARSQGVQVALTAGDPGVVERHRSTMQNLMSR
eukprot:1154852-Pelagomonas_calceolata.AAC.6